MDLSCPSRDVVILFERNVSVSVDASEDFVSVMWLSSFCIILNSFQEILFFFILMVGEPRLLHFFLLYFLAISVPSILFKFVVHVH